jgi:phosphatidylglycerophosphate synthase
MGDTTQVHLLIMAPSGCRCLLLRYRVRPRSAPRCRITGTLGRSAARPGRHTVGDMELAPSPTGTIASQVGTVPNAVTVTRTVAAVVLGVAALVHHSPGILVGAYAVYWAGDMLDGWSARRLGQETRIGAVLDIICDRACMAVLAGAYLALRPAAAVPMGVFLLQFMVLDCVLSLAFLGWAIKSPNDFHVVDPLVYRLNWSPPAKALNTSAVVLAMLLGHMVVALALGLALIVLKSWSARRVLTLRDWS